MMMDWFTPDALVANLREMGVLAIPVCLLLMTVSAIVPIPAELPAMLNGAVLGLWVGSAVTWTGAMLGAWVSYLGASWLQGRYGERWLGTRGRERLASLGHTTGAAELLLLRVTPVVAFHLLNYAAGLSRVPRARFFWTTAIGILPGTLAFTASGVALAHWMANPWIGWGALALAVCVIGWRLSRR